MIVTVLAFVFFVSGCKKEVESVTEINEIAVGTGVLNYIKSLGYKESEIKDLGDEYLVDGDIIFPKNTQITSVNGKSQSHISQYSTANLIGQNFNNISIRVDGTLSMYLAEINQAIWLWNSVPNCRLNFSVWSGAGTPDITIINTNSSQYCGAANFPLNGRPGSIIRISASSISAYSSDFSGQLTSVIAHEIGHAIGFRHTNWKSEYEPKEGVLSLEYGGARYNAMQILGTPNESDPLSIMNGSTCGIAPTSLSDFDILAVQFLYPETPPAPGTVPVFRYYGGSDHYYTTVYNELGDGNNNGWKFEGVGFFAYKTAVPGSVPIYRYYNSANGDHYYTQSYSSYSGYILEGTAFFAYPAQINGSVPVLGYFNGADHFYTKNSNEFYSETGGYVYELNAFYAY